MLCASFVEWRLIGATCWVDGGGWPGVGWGGVGWGGVGWGGDDSVHEMRGDRSLGWGGVGWG